MTHSKPAMSVIVIVVIVTVTVAVSIPPLLLRERAPLPKSEWGSGGLCRGPLV